MTTEEPRNPNGPSPGVTKSESEDDELVLIEIRIPLPVVRDAIDSLSLQSTHLHWLASELSKMNNAPESEKLRSEAIKKGRGEKILLSAMQRAISRDDFVIVPPPPASQAQSGNGVQSVITTNNHPEPLPQKALPWFIVQMCFAVGAFLCALFTMLWVANSERRMQESNAQTEARLREEFNITRRYVEELRIRVTDNDVLLQLSGLRKPGDSVAGPSANPQRLKSQE